MTLALSKSAPRKTREDIQLKQTIITIQRFLQVTSVAHENVANIFMLKSISILASLFVAMR